MEFLGFGLNAWITIVTVFSMFTVLLFTKWRSDIVSKSAKSVSESAIFYRICKKNIRICNFFSSGIWEHF